MKLLLVVLMGLILLTVTSCRSSPQKTTEIYIEDFKTPTTPTHLSAEAAAEIAERDCLEAYVPISAGEYHYNKDTFTWWVDVAPYEEKEGCTPACVVDEKSNNASINWRCTGVIPSVQEPESYAGDYCMAYEGICIIHQ